MNPRQRSQAAEFAEPNRELGVMEAIYQRRSVRDYLPEAVSRDDIRMLLDAAVHAPTAMHEEPWAFAVISDRELLERISTTARELMAQQPQPGLHREATGSIFYNAPALIVIYSRFNNRFTDADCWLACENILLAARAHGLATCVIGSAVPALNTPRWKIELGVPAAMTAVAPIIVGRAATEPAYVPRRVPDLLAWI